MPCSATQTLLLTFFSRSETAFSFVVLLPFALLSLPLLLCSVLFLFSLALFSAHLREPAFVLLFQLRPLTLADVLRRLSVMMLLLALECRMVSFLFLCLTRSHLLVLVIAFFGLLLFALLDPTFGRLGNRIGLLGPLFGHHVSLRDLLPTDHSPLNGLLASHQHALFASPWPTHWLGWPSHPPFPVQFFGCPAFVLLLLCLLLPSHQDRDLHGD